MQDHPSAQAAPANQLLDQLAVKQVAQSWAMWRDTCAWDQLRACYAPGAQVQTTWMKGSADAFIDASIKSAANPKAPRALHSLGASTVEIAGDKALAETRMILLVRGVLEGVEVDITAHGRFVDWLVRHQDRWCILRRHSIHEKDRLDPVDPDVRLALDPQRLAQFPRAYRHIAYFQSAGGATITPDLAEHNTASQEALYRAGEAWLRS
jgi:hypothetical protein